MFRFAKWNPDYNNNIGDVQHCTPNLAILLRFLNAVQNRMVFLQDCSQKVQNCSHVGNFAQNHAKRGPRPLLRYLSQWTLREPEKLTPSYIVFFYKRADTSIVMRRMFLSEITAFQAIHIKLISIDIILIYIYMYIYRYIGIYI